MIVNHATDQQISLPALLRLFPNIISSDHPQRDALIAQGGYRTQWADSEPTDAELRLIGYSYLVEVTQPVAGDGEQARQGPHELVNDEWRQTWIVEPVPVVVPDSVETHKILIAMDAAGYLTQANTLIDAANGAIKIAFDRAPYIHRNSPMVVGMADQMWPSDDEATKSAKLDALFIAAAAIQT